MDNKRCWRDNVFVESVWTPEVLLGLSAALALFEPYLRQLRGR
jgi:hypothetical protein